MNEPKTRKQIQASLWKEFLPLSLSDVVMAAGDPLVTTTLAHLPGTQVNIGAFGVAKSLAVVFESPIIMILHASNVLGKNKQSRQALWRFTLLLSGFLSLGLFFISIPYFFSLLAKSILGIDGELARHTQTILSILAPWPLFIGWRRFFQGLLIQGGYSKQVGRASIGRLLAIGLILLLGFWQKLPGPIVAASSLIVSLFVEALLVTLMAIRKDFLSTLEQTSKKTSDSPKTFKAIWKFYWPLASTSIVVWGGRALLLAIVARSVDGVLALATWTAGWGLVLVIANATRMVQQVIIRQSKSFLESDLLFFAGSVGFVTSLLLVAVGLTPVGEKLLQYFLGGDQELIVHVMPVLAICSFIPLGIALQNAFQGFLIADGKTKFVGLATWLNIFALLSSASILIALHYSGAIAAAIAMVFALFVELLLLRFGAGSKLFDKKI